MKKREDFEEFLSHLDDDPVENRRRERKLRGSRAISGMNLVEIKGKKGKLKDHEAFSKLCWLRLGE